MSIASVGTAGGPFPSGYRSELRKPIYDPAQIPSPERLAEIAEDRRRSEEGLRSQREMAEAAKIQTNEVHYRNEPNVSTLTREQALQQIESMSELIQSGQTEEMKLFTGYGDKATSNFRQYIYWLQQHVKALDGQGQSTLAQA